MLKGRQTGQSIKPHRGGKHIDRLHGVSKKGTKELQKRYKRKRDDIKWQKRAKKANRNYEKADGTATCDDRSLIRHKGHVT